MSESYSTRKGFKKHSYEIKEDGVSVFISNPISKEEYKVPFDAIPATSATYSERSKPAFWCMIIFSVFSVICLGILFGDGDVEKGAWLFWGFFAVVSATCYFLSKKTYIIYTGLNDASLFFKVDNKSEEDVEDFISKINTAKLKYLEIKIKQYLTTLGQDQIAGYVIDLRERMVLDDKGYDYIMKRVNEFNKVNIMGFKKA